MGKQLHKLQQILFLFFAAALLCCGCTSLPAAQDSEQQDRYRLESEKPEQNNTDAEKSVSKEPAYSESEPKEPMPGISESGEPSESGTTGAENGIEEPSAAGNLEIHFLDVGQGLSILVRCGGQTLLYDGGDRNYASYVVSYLKAQQVERLDYLIASHYDSDHINGLIGALHVFAADTVIGPDYEHDSNEYRSFINTMSGLGKEIQHPVAGVTYPFGDAVITILSSETSAEKSNNYSVAIKIQHHENSVIVMADAEYEVEKKMIESGLDLNCDVLVAGHHGSASSTTWELLQQTTPEAVIISAGAGNPYGHPHEDVMEKLALMELDVYRTDIQGTIIAGSDGDSLSWNLEACGDYAAGSDETIRMTGIDRTNRSSYVLNTSTKKVHIPTCSSVAKMAEHNYQETADDLEQILNRGYTRCGICMK